METFPDFEELLALFNANDAEFLIVGGHAVAFHEKPRYTKDIDVLIRPDQDNAERIVRALDQFGFGDADLSPDDFLNPNAVVQLGVPPQRVDILPGITGVSFEDAWKGRVQGAYGKTSVYFIGRAELIRNKRAVGRPQDLLDLSWLEE